MIEWFTIDHGGQEIDEAEIFAGVAGRGARLTRYAPGLVRDPNPWVFTVGEPGFEVLHTLDAETRDEARLEAESFLRSLAEKLLNVVGRRRPSGGLGGEW